MFCKKCGQELPEGGKFCPNCGADNTVQPMQASTKQEANEQPVFTGTVSGGSAPKGIANRNIAICILLSIVTCGIYLYVWLYQMAEDLKTASGDANAPSGIMVVLLTLVTCGIYVWYWLYKAGEQLNTAKAARGMVTDPNAGILYIILSVLGLGIVSYCLIQSELNKFAA
ncbi:MAG: DUF4234 domain-containing protein [Clostridia bacterium]|nr:DUF4234 domain-containing protein [Clostridia bacterium]